MPWVKLDDQFTEHPKVVEAGPLAAWLYVCGLTYCARQLTDGFVPTAQLRRLLPSASVVKLADRLVEVRLWEPASGGYRVHDYLIYNPSRQQTLATRKQKADAGRKGGWQKASNALAECQPDATTPVPVPVPVPLSAATQPEHQPQTETSIQDMLLRPAEAARLSITPKSLERYSSDFEAFWAIYARKRDKQPAFTAYEKLRKRGATPDQLRTAAEHFAAFVEENGTEEAYVPYAATWMNEGKWLDFRDGVPRPAPRSNGRAAPKSWGALKQVHERRTAAAGGPT